MEMNSKAHQIMPLKNLSDELSIAISAICITDKYCGIC